MTELTVNESGAFVDGKNLSGFLTDSTGLLARDSRTAIKEAGLPTGQTVYNKEAGYEGAFTLTSGDYSSTVDEYATLTDDAINNTTAAWVKKFNRDPMPQDFGGTDHAAFTRAITYAERETGSLFVQGLYELDDDLYIDSDLVIHGQRGGTTLDFSSKSVWAGNTFDGLIKFNGSIGTGINLAQNVAPRTGPLFRITSATRSGTTATFVTDRPHGLSIGDPVWTQTDVHSSYSALLATDDAVFMTMNVAVANGLAVTSPFIVASVPTTTSITVTCEDTGATTMSAASLALPIYLYYAANVIILGSTTGFTQGDQVQIGSTATRNVPSGTEAAQIGERNTVARVDASINALILHTDVRGEYLTTDTAKVFPLSPIRAAVKDFKMKGKGPNTGSGYGDRGILFNIVESPSAKGISQREIDQMGVLTRNCTNVEVINNDIIFNATDAAGLSSGSLDIQYGYADDSSDGGIWTHNYCHGGRHAWDQSGSSATSLYGVARNLTVAFNTFQGQWWSSVATHQGVENLSIIGNQIAGVHTGCDIRYCKDIQVTKNNIDAKQYGVLAKNYVGNIDISDNPKIRAGIAPVAIRYGFLAETSTEFFKGPIKINRNLLLDGENSVVIFDTYNEREAYIQVDDNIMEGASRIPIDILVAPTSNATGFWNGSVSRNKIRNLNTVGTQNAVLRSYNAIDVDVKDNVLDLPSSAFSYGIALLGDNTSGCNIDGTKFIGAEPTTNRVTTNANSFGNYGSDVPYIIGTISGGAYTLTREDDHMVLLRGEGNVADDLDQLIGLRPGQLITFVRYSETITIRDQASSGVAFDAGALQLPGGTTVDLDSGYKSITFLGTGSAAYPVAVRVVTTV